MPPSQKSRIERLREAAWEFPEWYFKEILGVSFWAKQLEIVKSIQENEKTLVYSCVSSGKSHAGGAIIPWWLNSHYPARVFIVAPTERQIKVNLWGEFRRIHGQSRIPLGGDPLTLDWNINSDLYAKGFSPKDAASVFGLHGPNDLFIFDDAQGVTADVIDAFENASAGGTAKFLFLCNPTFISGPLYDAITGKRGNMHTIQIAADDTPNVQAGHIVIPGLLTREKRDQWIEKYGFDSNFVRVKVRALPPKQEPDTLIPIDWLEIARAREVPQGQRGVRLGMDVARFGDDDTVIGAKEGRQYHDKEEWVVNGNDLTKSTGLLLRAAQDVGAVSANIDSIGIGAGVVDMAAEKVKEKGLKVNIRGINVGEKARDEKRFVNKRAEVWWSARESLDPRNEKTAMSLAGCSDELIADLSAMKYGHRSDGRIEIESKEETKARLGRSPDRGDAYALAVFEDYMEGTRPAVVFNNRPGLPRTPSWL